MGIRLCKYINCIIISLVYEDDDFVPVERKEESADFMDMKKMLSLMHDMKDQIAELVTGNRELKKTQAAMAKEMAELNKRLKTVQKAVAPKYTKLPLLKFNDKKSDELVSDIY